MDEELQELAAQQREVETAQQAALELARSAPRAQTWASLDAHLSTLEHALQSSAVADASGMDVQAYVAAQEQLLQPLSAFTDCFTAAGVFSMRLRAP